MGLRQEIEELATPDSTVIDEMMYALDKHIKKSAAEERERIVTMVEWWFKAHCPGWCFELLENSYNARSIPKNNPEGGDE